MLKEGIWEEETKILKCPYCLNKFRPRRFSSLSAKQCPQCHRYFLLPRNLVMKLVSDINNIDMIKKEFVERMGLKVLDRETDEDLQSYIIKLIENKKLFWDTRGWFFALKRGDLK